jgi:hypothetical protein
LGAISFFGAGGHTSGAGALVGVDMEAMRAERRGVDMARMSSLNNKMASIFIRKNGFPLFFFLYMDFFLL